MGTFRSSNSTISVEPLYLILFLFHTIFLKECILVCRRSCFAMGWLMVFLRTAIRENLITLGISVVAVAKKTTTTLAIHSTCEQRRRWILLLSYLHWFHIECHSLKNTQQNTQWAQHSVVIWDVLGLFYCKKYWWKFEVKTLNFG